MVNKTLPVLSAGFEKPRARVWRGLSSRRSPKVELRSSKGGYLSLRARRRLVGLAGRSLDRLFRLPPGFPPLIGALSNVRSFREWRELGKTIEWRHNALSLGTNANRARLKDMNASSNCPAIGFCSRCPPVISSGLCRSLNKFAANARRS